MTTCFFCGKEMARHSKLRYIIDWNTETIKGQAHTTCTKKQSQDLRLYPDTPPTPEQIHFAKVLKREMERLTLSKRTLHEWILLHAELFKATTKEEWINSPKVEHYLDWWLKGSKIITKQEHTRLKNWMQSLDDGNHTQDTGTDPAPWLDEEAELTEALKS